MSKGSIRVSPRHGLNTFIPGCFWCGKLKNMIALPGRLKGDMEAHNGMVIDVEPCDECLDGFKQTKDAGGILLFEVGTEAQVGEASVFKPIQEGRWLTGRMVGITEKGYDNIFPEAQPTSDDEFEAVTTHNEMRQKIKNMQVAFIDKEMFTDLFEDAVDNS